MADISIVRGGDTRVFLQTGGIAPDRPYEYFGAISLTGAEQNEGDPTPIYLPSSEVRNAWDIVDEAPTVQELGSADFTQLMDRFLADAWYELRRKKCLFNVQIVLGRCQKPDDFTRWDSKIILRNCRLTSFSLPDFNPRDGSTNDGLELTGSLSFRELIPVRSIKFGERGSTVIVAEVLDGVVNDHAQCGDCGDVSDGCQRLFFLTLANAGSPGLSSQLVYSTDGGSTMTGLDIPTLGGSSGTRIGSVGNFIVVISEAGENHHVISVDDAVANDTLGWSAVDDGYVAGKGPRAIWSKSSAETYIAGAGGYIYRLSDPSQGVEVLSDGSLTAEDFNDIHGFGEVVLVVGDNNAVAVSTSSGNTFSLIDGPALGINLTAVWAISRNVWFVGTANGGLYYTTNSGTTWSQISLPAGITNINDIHFVDDVVGYLAAQVGGSARVYRTTDSGHSWQNSDPTISNLPTAERINVVVPCHHNFVAAAGRKTAGGDGIVAIAE